MAHLAYVITYVGCPVLRCSKLQTEIAFSTTELEYILLIQVIRNIIFFMALMKEISFIFDVNIINLEVFCKVLE